MGTRIRIHGSGGEAARPPFKALDSFFGLMIDEVVFEAIEVDFGAIL